MTEGSGGRVAVVFRDEPRAAGAPSQADRLRPMFTALAEAGLTVKPVVYEDEAAAEVRRQLLAAEAVLVWVDPLSNGKDREQLDGVLRDVAAQGVLVSAHPDVILKMGTKEVLYRTRSLGWGADTYLYRTADEFRQQFPGRLEASGPRVLKQYRGNGGQGVWKVELVPLHGGGPVVRVQHAKGRDATAEELPLSEFMARCDEYFGAARGEGPLIDHAFQSRITEGMIRCYMVQSQVVGFARQYADRSAGDNGIFGLPSAKTMYSPEEPPFQALRRQVETEWVPEMQQRVGVDSRALPLLWDADFLFGPRLADGQDTYVLCEINASCITPFPEGAPPAVAAALTRQLSRRAQSS